MKKTTKLLSVILAVVMMMSCFTMAAFAAVTNVKTGTALNSLGAYSPDGAATRFSTEERASILLDWLDNVLGKIDFDPIHNTQVVTIDISINSVDEVCSSLSSIKSALSNPIVSIGGSLLPSLIGDIKNLKLSTWSDSSRSGTAQLTILSRIINVLNENAGLVETILKNGSVSLGSIVEGKLPEGTKDKINGILYDLPKLALSKLYPLMSRKDDTKAVANNYFNGSGNPSTVLNNFVNGLFSKPQSTTTYKEDAEGNCISGHTLPSAPASNLRYYYVKSGSGDNTCFICYVYNPETQAYETEGKFYRTMESEGVYTYKNSSGDGLKYYKNGSYWLPSFVGQTININNESAADLLYKFAPYVFKDLAPIALNGWAKHALATWMGATETKIYEGKAGTSEASAVLATLPAGAQAMFTDDVPYYQFSYSAYDAEGNGDTQYYRWVDKDTNVEEWFKLDMTTGNYFLSLFNFGYTVSDNFMDEFVPASGTAKKTLFQSLNKFLCKAAKTVLTEDAYTELKNAGLDDTGDNTKIVSNLRTVAQKLLPRDPDAILGPDYLVHYDGYYQTLIDTNASNDEVFSALAAIIAKALMPQLILPSADNLAGQKVGAVLACVVRELVTQFVPTYNYDALIFSDYNTRTLVSGKDNNYWLDVILTMGVDVGMSYLSNLTDLGSDKANGYKFEASKTYDLATFEANPQAWEKTVDWIVDWALDTDVEWGWNIKNLVDVSGLTINKASPQDPWAKLDKILNDLLPLKQIINCTAASGKTWLETVLRDKLILGIADLHFEYIFGKGEDYTASGNAGLLSIPSTSILRTSGTNTGALTQIFIVVRNLLNKVFYKLLGSTNLFDTSVFKASSEKGAIDTLVYHKSTSDRNTNIRKPVNVLLTKLPTAHTNGLWVTVLPILEMFIGWKTGSQEYKDPGVSWSDTTIKDEDLKLVIENKSAGMLLRNYKAGSTTPVYEQAYNLVIESISADGLTFNGISANTTLAPFEFRKITVSRSGNQPAQSVARQVVIKYHMTSKSGGTLGEGSKYLTTFILDSAGDSDIDCADIREYQYDRDGKKGCNKVSAVVDFDYNGNTNVIVRSAAELKNAVESHWFQLKNYSGTYSANITNAKVNNANPIFAVSALGNNGTFTLATNGEQNMTPFKFANGKTEANFVSGTVYSFGTFSFDAASSVGSDTTYDPVSGSHSLGSLYYRDTKAIEDLYWSEAGMNRHSSQYNDSAATAYNNYVAAMKDAAVIVCGPEREDTFATVYSKAHIDATIEAINTAVETLENNKKVSAVNVLNDALAQTEVKDAIGADGQINFQDYKLYDYWMYEKNRTAARDIVKSFDKPVAPQQYIEGCWLPYEDTVKHEDLSTVIANEANTTKADAITDTLEQPSASAVTAYQAANSEWKDPVYLDTYVYDIADKLTFYNQFLVDRDYSKVATGRAQLAQEIAYAAAQNYNEDDYTAKSWARYQDALAAANTANVDGTFQSVVFQAKYDLLVAQRQLRLKANDYATQVGFEDLQALVDLAEGMFANAEYFTAVDETLDTEWADLIKALGYEANFGTDDDAWSMNLYDDSATELMTEELYYPLAQNEDKVERVTAALQAAIDALKCTIEVVKKDATTLVDQDVKYITNLTPLTLASASDVLTHVMASSNAATLAVTATANGFGTGTKVAVSLNSIPLTNYFVVIYGDVNGDNAIDGFDAVKADRKLAASLTFDAPLEKAADATKDGSFGIDDVGAIIDAAAGITAIAQD